MVAYILCLAIALLCSTAQLFTKNVSPVKATSITIGTDSLSIHMHVVCIWGISADAIEPTHNFAIAGTRLP